MKLGDQSQFVNPPPKPTLFGRLRRAFLTGVIFIAPLAITIYFIWSFINFIDSKVEPFIPPRFNPNVIWGYDVPGLGVLFFVVVATVAGFFARGLLGRETSKFVRNIVNQFPFVRTIYNALSQILETVFSDNGRNFENAVLIEYPRKGIYAVGFIAAEAKGEVKDKSGRELYAVFLPTTPNPTSGFLLYFPKEDVQILDMSVEQAAKLIISAGLIEPAEQEDDATE